MLEAAAYFQGRVPETFAGYPRQATRYPVEHPTACSPQVWATATPLLMLRAMLGLEPEGRRLRSHPVLPPQIASLELRGIFWRGGRTDIVAGAAEEMNAPPHVHSDVGEPAGRIATSNSIC